MPNTFCLHGVLRAPSECFYRGNRGRTTVSRGCGSIRERIHDLPRLRTFEKDCLGVYLLGATLQP